MNRHMSGKVVPGAKTTELVEPDVRAIREAVSAQDFMISPHRLPITDHGGSPVHHLPFAVHRRVKR